MTSIVDAHHHVWRASHTPWLTGPIVPRIFGDYTPLQRDYGIDEFIADAAPSGVIRSVFIQANVAPGGEVDEVEWAYRSGRGFIAAVVGYADLGSPEVGDVLDRQSAVAPLRGIRQQLHWHPRPEYRFATEPAIMAQPAWRRGLRQLERRGLHFELQVFPGQFADSLRLVDEFESLRFVLVHSGMPEDLSPAGREAWSRGLAEFARRPNVVTKVSGLGTFARQIIADDWRDVIRTAVDLFGPARTLFGSNFPIEKLWTDYAALIATVEECLAVYTPDERAEVWGGTATRTYRLQPDPTPINSLIEKETT